MNRRIFLYASIAALARPVAAEAQQAEKVYRVGVLETTSVALNATNMHAFRLALKQLGYVEGRNLVIEYRSADGRPERFPVLATDLVRSKVDLILTRGTPAVIAARH